MTNALTVYDQFDELERAAIALQQSGYFKDVTSKAQAIVKVMAGAELGLPPFASMTGIHIIQGNPVIGANVVATLVKNDPRYDYQIKTATNELCELTWYESVSVGGQYDREVGTSDFTIEEAKSAGLASKDNWKKYPSDMLFARAISRGARRFAPGIFGGSPIYTPDELGADVDENGNTIVDSVAVDVPVTEPDPEPNPGDNNSKMTLEEAREMLNSQGEKYGSLDYEKLTHMSGALIGALKKTDLTDNEREIREDKLEAIRLLLNDR
jgi:hypothetical protein